MKVDNIRNLVGNTPCVPFVTDEAPGVRFWVKLEGCNPSGSVKDRACLYNLDDAIASGRLRRGQTILDASSGNMACALAYFGRLLDYPVTVICSSKLTADKAGFIRYFVGELIVHGDLTVEGNRLCRQLVEAEPDKYCFLDQLHNWANPTAHYETTAPEIFADFPDVTAIVGSLGSGGTMAGIGRRVREQKPHTLVVAVQAAAGTKLPGTGAFDDGEYVTPFIARALEDGLFDIRWNITLDAARARTHEAAKQGIFAGLQTGGVIEAAIAIARARRLEGDIVAISGDSGWKNMEKLIQAD
jgi:[CysO sulfur-carrier protein]-thiocarboxylate-dependent cysteine synthase